MLAAFWTQRCSSRSRPAEQDAFKALLELSDNDLWDLVQSRAQAEPATTGLLRDRRRALQQLLASQELSAMCTCTSAGRVLLNCCTI